MMLPILLFPLCLCWFLLVRRYLNLTCLSWQRDNTTYSHCKRFAHPYVHWYWLLTIVIAIEQQGVLQFIFHLVDSRNQKSNFAFLWLSLELLLLLLYCCCWCWRSFLSLFSIYFGFGFAAAVFLLLFLFACAVYFFFYSKMSLKLLKFTSRDIRCKATLSGMCIQNSFLRASFFCSLFLQ